MGAEFSRRSLLAALGATMMLPAVGASAASLDKVRAAGQLRVAVYRDFAPWAWLDGDSWRGIDIEIGKAIAQKLGVKFELMDILAGEDVDDDLRNAVWRGSLIGGQVADVMMHVPYDRTFALRNDRVVIVAPYYREGFAIACGRDVDCEVPPPQFKGRRLAAELDSIPDFYLSGSFGGVLRPDVRHLPSGMAALESVRDATNEVAMATRAQVEHALSKGGTELGLRKGPIPALSSPGWDIAVAVKDDSRDLGDAIEQIIPAMAADKSLDAIFARYGVSLRAPIAS